MVVKKMNYLFDDLLYSYHHPHTKVKPCFFKLTFEGIVKYFVIPFDFFMDIDGGC